MPGEKCNDIEVLAETSETFNGEHCAEVNGPYDLADIITGWRTVSILSCIEKHGYLTKHYFPLDQEFLYRLSWIKSKWWHTYNMKYFIILVLQKISEHETKDYHNKALEKAKNFVITFEDPTKVVTQDKHEND